MVKLGGMAEENYSRLSHRAFVSQIAAEQGRTWAAGILAVVVGPSLTALLIEFSELAPLLSILAGVAFGVLVCLLTIFVAQGLRWPAPKSPPMPRTLVAGSGAAQRTSVSQGSHSASGRIHERVQANVDEFPEVVDDLLCEVRNGRRRAGGESGEHQ